MSQTTTLTIPVDGILGGIADAGFTDKISRVAEGVIYLGLAHVFGTNQPSQGTPGQVAPIGDGAAAIVNFAGIPIWESGREPYTVVNGKSTLPDKAMVSLMRKGRIWVYTETAVSPTSDVFVRVLTVSADVKGQFRAGTATNFIALPGAKFITSTTGAGLAVLELS